MHELGEHLHDLPPEVDKPHSQSQCPVRTCNQFLCITQQPHGVSGNIRPQGLARET